MTPVAGEGERGEGGENVCTSVPMLINTRWMCPSGLFVAGLCKSGLGVGEGGGSLGADEAGKEGRVNLPKMKVG